jgi:hypothetical protein
LIGFVGVDSMVFGLIGAIGAIGATGPRGNGIIILSSAGAIPGTSIAGDIVLRRP